MRVYFAHETLGRGKLHIGINRTSAGRNRQVVSILILCFALSALAACGNKGASAAPPPAGPMPVTVARIQQQDVPLTGDWVGTLDGYVNAQIQPQVSGYLIRQNYREGSQVAKGALLFEIDPRPFQ